MATATPKVDIEEFLRKLDPPIQPLTRALRRVILEVVPGVEETIMLAPLIRQAVELNER